MAINEIPENKPGAPTDLAETAENTPGNPTDLAEVAESSPGNPNALTELSESSPGNPSNLAEVSESNPAVPNNLVEVSESTPGNPSNLTELAESTPGNPSNLTEVAEGSLAVPTNLTEIADSTPGNPSNLTEVAENTAGNPTSLTLTAEKFLPRTLTPRINLNFGSNSYELNGVAKAIDDIVTYSRSSSATYIERFTNQFGQRDYRLANDFVGTVTNLVTYSEQFEEWTASNAVVATNKIINPVTNTAAAEKVSDNTTNAVHTLTAASATVTSGATVNLSIRAKAGTLSKIGLFETQSADGVLFDIQSGAIISETGTPDEASVKYLSDGWYELSVTVTVPATSAVFAIYLDSLSAYTGSNEYLYIVGAQLTESVKSLPYVKTLSASASDTFSASPRLEYDPSTGEALGYLSEGAATNLLTFSEEFDDASYSKINSTVSKNQIIAPDGTKSADKLVEDATAAAQHRLDKTFTFTALPYSFSVYAKAAERNRIVLRVDTTGGLHVFNLEDGTVSGTSGDSTAEISFVGDGWYRCSVTVTAVATAGIVRINLDDGTGITYDGDGSSGVYLWGAQNEALPFASSYIKTESATVSRGFDVMSFSKFAVPPPLKSASKSVHTRYSLNALNTIAGSDFNTIFRSSDTNWILRVGAGGSHSISSFHGSNSASLEQSTPSDLSHRTATVVYNGSNSVATIYNEALASTTFTMTDATFSGSAINIGSAAGGGSQYLWGHVYSVIFYDVALTSQEVALL